LGRRAKQGCCRDKRLYICACIAIAAQELNCPRIYKEIAAVTGFAWRCIVTERRKVDKIDICKPVTLSVRGRDLVVRNAQRFGLGTDQPERAQRRLTMQAKRLCDAMEDLPVAQGRSASTIVAASCFIVKYGLGEVSKRRAEVKQVADASGVAPTTVRKLLDALRADDRARSDLERGANIKT
jgi:transcription initiation factor TFIIIB Brf1 subunit/transcription initiation factor TFIIB